MKFHNWSAKSDKWDGNFHGDHLFIFGTGISAGKRVQNLRTQKESDSKNSTRYTQKAAMTMSTQPTHTAINFFFKPIFRLVTACTKFSRKVHLRVCPVLKEWVRLRRRTEMNRKRVRLKCHSPWRNLALWDSLGHVSHDPTTSLLYMMTLQDIIRDKWSMYSFFVHDIRVWYHNSPSTIPKTIPNGVIREYINRTPARFPVLRRA